MHYFIFTNDLLSLLIKAQFLCYTGKFSKVRKTLSIHNSIIGYAFLLDSKGLIRWRAHGYPNEREINALLKCTSQLIKN